MPISPPPSGPSAAPSGGWSLEGTSAAVGTQRATGPDRSPTASAAGSHPNTGTPARALTRQQSTAKGRRPAATGGLTTSGVAVLLCLVTGLALTLDLLLGTGLGWLFGIGFVLACTWAAWRVRRADLMAALIAPPLVFATAVLVADQVVGGTSPGRFPVRQVLDLATSLADGAPILLAGCGLAGAVVLVRRWRDPRP